MKTLDKKLLLKPLTEKGVMKSRTPAGIPFVGNYDHLVKSEALADYPPENIKTGDMVYIRGTAVKAQWARTVYDLGDGREGVLAPLEEVVLVEPGASRD